MSNASFRESLDMMRTLLGDNTDGVVYSENSPIDIDESIVNVLSERTVEKLVGNTAITTIVNGCIGYTKTVMGGKLDKGSYSGTAQNLKESIDTVSARAKNVIAGNGITSADSDTNRTINIVSANDGIIVNADNIQLSVAANLTTNSATKALAANQGVVIKSNLDKLAAGITTTAFYNGTLTKNTKSIAVGKTLYKPSLYLDGIRIDSKSFTFSGTSITLTEVYSSKYDVTWEVEDRVPTPLTLSTLDISPMAMSLDVDDLSKPHVEIYELIKFNSYKLQKDMELYKNITFDINNGNIISLPVEVLLQSKNIISKIYKITNNSFTEILVQLSFTDKQNFTANLIDNKNSSLDTVKIPCKIYLTQ